MAIENHYDPIAQPSMSPRPLARGMKGIARTAVESYELYLQGTGGTARDTNQLNGLYPTRLSRMLAATKSRTSETPRSPMRSYQEWKHNAQGASSNLAAMITSSTEKSPSVTGSGPLAA